MNILIAEDDRYVTELYRISLESRGHNVVIAYDGKKCINIYKEAFDRLIQSNDKKFFRYEPFDVVVLDYRMPEVDGLLAAKEILKLHKGQRIILSSALAMETLKSSVRELGQVVEIIQKPFEPKVLIELVEDTSVTKELNDLNNKMEIITHAPESYVMQDNVQLSNLLDTLKRIQKVGF